jgi:uncharacterized membrane protein YhaH (DUF805 family)
VEIINYISEYTKHSLAVIFKTLFTSVGRINRLTFIIWFFSTAAIYLFLLTTIVMGVLIFFLKDLVFGFFCFIFTINLKCINLDSLWKACLEIEGYLWVCVIIFSILLPSVILVPLKRLRDAGLNKFLFILWFLPALNIILILVLFFYPTQKK